VYQPLPMRFPKAISSLLPNGFGFDDLPEELSKIGHSNQQVFGSLEFEFPFLSVSEIQHEAAIMHPKAGKPL